MNSKETVLSGKQQAKLNNRKAFYTKLEKRILGFEKDPAKEIFFPLFYQKQSIFPEYDDMTLILKDVSEVIKDIHEESKGMIISLPDVDEGYFFKEMATNDNVKLFREEVFENADGTIRKGSTGSIEDYNYQSAYNFFIQIVKKDELIQILSKEKDNPSEYSIPVKTKKFEKKKYVKTYRYPNKRKG